MNALKVHQWASVPVLSRGRLLSHVVHHIHLLLIWSKHLEASAVTAQMVHGAEDRVVNDHLWIVHCAHYFSHLAFLCWVILTKLPRGHQSHPTSHILRIPRIHCDSQIIRNAHASILSTDSPNILLICFTYHCNIGISPVAIITMVNKAGRLTRKNSQCLFRQQSPGCQHGLALISLF